MYSQQTVELKGSWIGALLWLVVTVLSAGLLQLYWMPVIWRVSILSMMGFTVAFLFFRVIYQEVKQQIGIENSDVFLFKKECLIPLEFVRANGIQLIAKMHRENKILDVVWPAYKVIYRDSVSRDDYQRLRSFAAQQILLRRSEEAKKRYS
ncbi:hypothetical protein MUS1_13530 [Marinomonas ushuaiensis DSM 15871]|uniref:Uncharacterized protein n=1 Tax=Marinomonas ushuaiensis DSM 15871 TaxID=1122207 RepID=X7E3F4_9GAMM|nr:hypothetical protein [Marinomonas ushuaiensis]ETX10599.1 hypothetical protein MUS1_13530 [Marinomonas ushuaiensis DSM 15871]